MKLAYWIQKKKLQNVKLFLTDFDGVHTNGLVYVQQDGIESVVCSRRDGLGFEMLKALGIPAYIISKETNPVVEARAKKLGITCQYGVATGQGKVDAIKMLIEKHQCTPDEVLYIADDVNDIDALKYVGVPIVVRDCHPEVRKYACLVTRAVGGQHAIREVIDLLVQVKKEHGKKI